MHFKRSVSPLLLVVSIVVVPLLSQEEEHPYMIRRGVVEFTPSVGQRAYPENSHKHLIVQFYQIPGADKQASLAVNGLKLIRYVGGNAYIARMDGDDLSILADREIRATVTLKPEMKRSRFFDENADLGKKILAGDRIGCYIRFHEEISFEHAVKILQSARISIDQTNFRNSKAVISEARWESIERLLETDEVDWIDTGLPEPESRNADAFVITNAADVYRSKEFMRIDGRGIIVGIWDSGPVGSHVDLKRRITLAETDETVSSHATYISGTIAGRGKLDAKAKGMSDRSSIVSYDFWDCLDELETAIATYDLMLSNHSWGYTGGWTRVRDSNGNFRHWEWKGSELFGYYHAISGEYDKIIRKHDFPFIQSAGNDRDDSYLGPHRHRGEGDTIFHDLHPPDPDYNSVLILTNAKNLVTVGALMKDKLVTNFSSWGPTDDGRIKPEVVAPGFGIYTTSPGNRYDYKSGTSLSAPAVTGISALLMDYYKRLGGGKMGAAMLKALLIHTAEDLGNPGPDYVYGFGMVDAELSARILRSAAKRGTLAGVEPKKPIPDGNTNKNDMVAQVISGKIKHKENLRYEFDVPEGSEELRATLVWHDVPGEKLINNLDLSLKTAGSKRVLPYSLDPAKPSTPAVRKRNMRDNVEHVLVEKPKPEKWIIEVKGARIPIGKQYFVLIFSAGSGSRPSEILKEGKIKLAAVRTFYTEATYENEITNVEARSTFSVGDSLILNFSGTISENADYGGYYGSVFLHCYVRDSDGNTVLKFFDERRDLHPSKPDQWSAPGEWSWWSHLYSIPNEMPPGVYNVEAIVTMHNGRSNRQTTSFRVE